MVLEQFWEYNCMRKKMHVKKGQITKKRNLVRVMAHEMGIESSLKIGGKKIRSSKPPTGSLADQKNRNGKVDSVFSQVVGLVQMEQIPRRDKGYQKS
jgi:hypothetical protein